MGDPCTVGWDTGVGESYWCNSLLNLKPNIVHCSRKKDFEWKTGGWNKSDYISMNKDSRYSIVDPEK